MRAVFGIAIGISAIDALLSAFTAVIVLALVLVSVAVNKSGSVARDINILQIEKTAPVRLELDIQGARDPSVIVQVASSPYTPLTATDAQQLFKNERGQLAWVDPPCATNPCQSHVTIVAPAGTWTMRLRIAGADSESAAMPADLKLAVSNVLQPNKAPCSKQLPVNGQLLFSIDFGGDAMISCK